MVTSRKGGLEIRLLGGVSVRRDGVELALPRSRKVRTLLAYLVLAKTPMSRSRLCDLLWDVANDPRGELRWCLSRLRAVLDDDGDVSHVTTEGAELVGLDLEGCFVDVLEIERLTSEDIASASTEKLLAIEKLFAGDLLGNMLADGAELSAWLTGHQQRFRTLQIAVVSELATRLDAEETFPRLETWLRLAPFDARAHEVMLTSLRTLGRSQDAEAHFRTTMRAFEAEGADVAPLREVWQAARRTNVRTTSSTSLRAAARPAPIDLFDAITGIVANDVDDDAPVSPRMVFVMAAAAS